MPKTPRLHKKQIQILANTNANTKIQVQIQVKKEVVANALATSNKEAARKYEIEEFTIRAWVKKVKAGTIDSSVVRKKTFFQQKYSEQVSIFLKSSQFKYLIQLKSEVVECAKTMSRKEIQSRFNVPGPTIRFSAIGS